MLRSLAALASFCLGCASAPQVVPAAFSMDAKLAIAGFRTDALPQGSFGLPEAYAAFRHDLTGCGRGTLLGDDVVMATESYRRMLHRIAAETWLEIPNGRLDAAGAAAMGRDAD